MLARRDSGVARPLRVWPYGVLALRSGDARRRSAAAAHPVAVRPREQVGRRQLDEIALAHPEHARHIFRAQRLLVGKHVPQLAQQGIGHPIRVALDVEVGRESDGAVSAKSVEPLSIGAVAVEPFGFFYTARHLQI